MVLHGTDPYTWRRLVRRVRLGASTKLVAYALADYANPDGTRVRPGNPRLIAVTELSDKTVRRSLSTLRELGLIERVFEGSKMGRRGLADEYRLTYDDQMPTSVEMLPPGEIPEEPVTSTDDPTGTPVTDTGDNSTAPVDNPGTPVTVTGDVAAEDSGTPVNDLRTPVTSSRNTGNCDRPPNHAPNHLSPTNKQDGSSGQRAEVEGNGPILVSSAERNDLASDDEALSYSAATRILSRTPDLGEQFRIQASAEMPDAPRQQQFIRAAELCLEGIPA